MKILQKLRKAERDLFDQEKLYDLDAELQKLEKIKEMRRSKLEEHRDVVNRAKLTSMTAMYFQQEHNLIKNQ
jgi:hypothetical protein